MRLFELKNEGCLWMNGIVMIGRGRKGGWVFGLGVLGGFKGVLFLFGMGGGFLWHWTDGWVSGWISASWTSNVIT